MRRSVDRELGLPEVAGQAGEIAQFVYRLLREEPGEVVGAVFVGRELRVLGFATPFRGTRVKAVVEVRHLLRLALGCEAEGLMLFHNHPWGEALPSDPDLELTRSAIAAGQAVGVAVIDHVIVGGRGDWYSMQERGVLGGGRRLEPDWRSSKAVDAEREKADRRRRVKPKYRDPNSGQTWAGRGSTPSWLRAHLDAGRAQEEFLIGRDDADDQRAAGRGDAGREEGEARTQDASRARRARPSTGPKRNALYWTARVDVEVATAKALDSLLRRLRRRKSTPAPDDHWRAAAREAEQLRRFAEREADRLADDEELGAIARHVETELGRITRRLDQRAGPGSEPSLSAEPWVRPTFVAELDDERRELATAFADQLRKLIPAKPSGKRRRIVLRALAHDVAALAEALRPRPSTVGALGDAALAESAGELTGRIREVLKDTAPRPWQRRRSVAAGG